MISGEELRAARSRAQLSQEELSDLLDVSLRSVGNWERGAGVPPNREGLVRKVLGDHLRGQVTAQRLASMDTGGLLAELTYRVRSMEDELERARPAARYLKEIRARRERFLQRHRDDIEVQHLEHLIHHYSSLDERDELTEADEAALTVAWDELDLLMLMAERDERLAEGGGGHDRPAANTQAGESPADETTEQQLLALAADHQHGLTGRERLDQEANQAGEETQENT